MPSPFPGMDPYLEAPDRWIGLHTRLVTVLGEMLAPEVAPRFFVDVEVSVYVVSPDDPSRHVSGRISEPRLLQWPRPIEVRTRRLVVPEVQTRRVVATIEVLSPANKVADSAGRDSFVGKREQIMQSPTHWLEIDLLRADVRPPEVIGNGDYYALLHRAGGDQLEAWFAGLRDPLPTIAVPLVDDLPDVPLDLQAAVTTVYSRNLYDIGLDYSQPPPAPPLSSDDAAWAAERIAAWQRARTADAQPTSA